MNFLKTTVLSRTITFFFAIWLFWFAGATMPIDAKIVLTVDDEIYVMNDDGSGRRRLTQSLQNMDSYPRWSPDGTQIAFTRYMDKTRTQTTSEVFVMNADGTDLKRLTDNNDIDAYHCWAPDGTQIAFSSTRSGAWEVFVIDLATLAVKQVTNGGRDAASASVDWSPDGTQITFERLIRVPNGIGLKTIYVMDADGTNQRPLLRDQPLDGPPILRHFPRWSADGQRIVFSESKWLKDGDIEHLIVQQIGGRKRVLTRINDRLGNNWMSTNVCWMDNDRSLLIAIKAKDKPTPNYDIYRYTIATQRLRRLPSELSDEKWPDWIEGALSVSPHGKLTTLWGEIKRLDPEHP
ncbi:hypothetical protein F4055_04230 [Candidatus Poribacteria bacterium]|nr:hypothetical protein [Candidatus Poribacteria bacterium]MYK17363.1 hypothetical protein [Candidatus Poribacteria bacterium]